MVDISSTFLGARRSRAVDETPQHRHVQEALARHKREGMDLAVKARVGALSATALFLIYLNPNWDVIWYLALLFCLVLVGLLQRIP